MLVKAAFVLLRLIANNVITFRDEHEDNILIRYNEMNRITSNHLTALKKWNPHLQAPQEVKSVLTSWRELPFALINFREVGGAGWGRCHKIERN